MSQNPDDFKLERLKHIYKQQEFLNEQTHKYLTVFQTVVTAIVVSAVAVFMSWRQLSISVDVARASIRSLEWLLVATGAFLFLVVFTNINSWWDYRKDEVKLFDEVVSKGFRAPPSLKGMWRWFETWLIVLVLCVVCGGLVFVETVVLPLIK